MNKSVVKTKTLMPVEKTSPDRQEMKLVPSKVWIHEEDRGLVLLQAFLGLDMVAQQNC